MVWHAQGDSKRAKRALTDVIKDHPDDQDAHYSLAIVYFSDGRTEQARREWQTAARIDPASVTGRRSQSFVDLIDGNESAAPEAGN
jgi:Tfp pilus assembly protein PilF